MTAEVVQVERAARSTDELQFLERIVDHPTDDAARLVYADWLEEGGDHERAALLRDCIAACQSGDWPSLDSVPPVWADITGLKRMQDCIQVDLRDLLHMGRPEIRLEVKKTDRDTPLPTPENIGTTRMGGDPDLPVGSIYPTTASGTPLKFICQLDLSDLQGMVAARYFPAAGLLSIFRVKAGLMPEVADCPRLVQFTPSGTKLARLCPPQENGHRSEPFRSDLRLVERIGSPGKLFGVQDPKSGKKLNRKQAVQLYSPSAHLGSEAYLWFTDRPHFAHLVLLPRFDGSDVGIWVDDANNDFMYRLPAEDLTLGRFGRLESVKGPLF